MTNKCVVIFVEGETEVYFYKKLIQHLRAKLAEKQLNMKVKFCNLKGIGNYKKRAVRIFNNGIKNKEPELDYVVALCYDTDVFEFSAKPKVVWSDVAKELRSNGVNKVVYVKAKKSIEDWFLCDKAGIFRYLKLSADTPIQTGKGADTLKKIFKDGGKVYIKGSSTPATKFIDVLDFNIIEQSICIELRDLCRELGMKCDKLSHRIKK